MTPTNTIIAVAFLLSVLGLIPGCSLFSDNAFEAADPAVALEDTIAMPAAADLDLTRCVALTDDERRRLRDAWRSDGPDRAPVAELIAKVDHDLTEDNTVPPEGGQHNQWYQCDTCQIALETIDAHHHKCPSCGEVYSGWPYDNVLYTRTHHHLSYVIYQASLAWAVTGEQKYADAAIELLLEYARLYTTLPRIAASSNKRPVPTDHGRYKSGGHILNQTLNEAMFTVNVARGMDILRHYGALGDEQLETINAGLIRPMIDSVRGHKAGKSNWQTWHNAAILCAAAVLEDPTLADEALAQPGNGFYEQMQISVLPEGAWYENSWGYHYYTLSAMTHIAEAARHLGGNLYADEHLKSMYLAAFDYLMPDGGLPRFGDAVGKGSFRRDDLNAAAYAAYGDIRLAAALPDEPTFESVMYGFDLVGRPEMPDPASCVKPFSGQAMLRSGSGDAQAAAVLNFGPYGGFHGHFDKQSIVFYGRREELAVDPGRAASQAYRLPIHSQWYKSTLSHSTVMIDGADQQPVDGILYTSEFTDDYAAAITGAPGLYGNAVQHDRFAALIGETLVVVDELRSLDGKAHRFDWLYHNAGTLLADSGQAADHAPLGLMDHPGAAYLQNVAVRSDETGGSAVFEVNDATWVSVNCLVLGGEKLTRITADGPFESVVDRVGMLNVAGTGEHVLIVSTISVNGSCPVAARTDTGGPLHVELLNVGGTRASISFPGNRIAEGFSIAMEAKQ